MKEGFEELLSARQEVLQELKKEIQKKQVALLRLKYIPSWLSEGTLAKEYKNNWFPSVLKIPETKL